ncbi:hypothetical protein TorRG33x02_311040, partial [Trema orientale]
VGKATRDQGKQRAVWPRPSVTRDLSTQNPKLLVVWAMLQGVLNHFSCLQAIQC